MRNGLIAAVTGILLAGGVAGAQSGVAGAQQKETYDYWQHQRRMVRHGQQAIFQCNGLFTSNRTLEQVFAQELAFLPEPVGTAAGGDYEVDHDRKAVVIGDGHAAPAMRAAFREGIGCVILAPDQTLDDIDGLPVLDLPPPPRRPGGDRLAGRGSRRGTHPAALRRRAGPPGGVRLGVRSRVPGAGGRSASSSCTAARSSTSATPRAST